MVPLMLGNPAHVYPTISAWPLLLCSWFRLMCLHLRNTCFEGGSEIASSSPPNIQPPHPHIRYYHYPVYYFSIGIIYSRQCKLDLWLDFSGTNPGWMKRICACCFVRRFLGRLCSGRWLGVCLWRSSIRSHAPRA